MATTSDIRNGLCIEHNNDVYKVLEFSRFQMGRGGSKINTKLKSTTTGKVIDYTFNSGANIKEVRIERRKFQYLYPDDMGLVLMNTETFDQVTLPKEDFTNPQFLKEGDIVDVLYHAEKEIPMSVELPSTVELEITYCEPGVKGDTATNSLKPATLETDAEIRVPLFCVTGDIVKIDTATGAYMERVKK